MAFATGHWRKRRRMPAPAPAPAHSYIHRPTTPHTIASNHSYVATYSRGFYNIRVDYSQCGPLLRRCDNERLSISSQVKGYHESRFHPFLLVSVGFHYCFRIMINTMILIGLWNYL